MILNHCTVQTLINKNEDCSLEYNEREQEVFLTLGLALDKVRGCYSLKGLAAGCSVTVGQP